MKLLESIKIYETKRITKSTKKDELIGNLVIAHQVLTDLLG